MTPNGLLSPSSLTASPRPKSRAGTFFVQTWGCQMNVEDSEQIGLYLRDLGLKPARSWAEAQVVVLNTCSVRALPEQKAFSFLGELRERKKDRPDMVIGVAGCMAQARAKEIRRRNPHVDFVVGTAHIAEVPGLVEEALQGKRFSLRLDLPDRKGAVVTDVPQRHLGREAKLKAFVPIQYGCDKFCTFCIVPTTRGRERSRPTQDILDEVAALAAKGTKEVTLLGQTVNSYGKNLLDGRVPFADLLREVAGIEGIERVRFTSPYPRDFRADLIQTIREVPEVMEHCHIPLQAGHDALLARMRRVYTLESFATIVESLRTAMPEVGLTTDVIVGFPGETDEEFEATMEAMRRFRFDGAYMFRYSPRPGTPAAELPQVDPQVAMDRLNRLIALQNGITDEINAGLVGREFEVLAEGPSPKDPAMWQGYTRCFRMVHFPAGRDLKGKTVHVRATRARRWGLVAELA